MPARRVRRSVARLRPRPVRGTSVRLVCRPAALHSVSPCRTSHSWARGGSSSVTSTHARSSGRTIPMTQAQQVDVVVIGMGPGGEEVAGLLAEARRVDKVAGGATVQPDLGPVARRIRAEATDDWDDKVAADRFEGKGGRLVRGDAKLEGPGRVRVGDDLFSASRGVVVATGSAPVVPPLEGLAEARHWTNREAISATTAPESLA